MTAQYLPPVLVAILVVITPLMVVRIALSIARWHAGSVGLTLPTPGPVWLLQRVTIAFAIVTPPIALLLTPPSLWMAAIDVLVFAVLAAIGARALGAVSLAARPATEFASGAREAALSRRAPNDSVPAAWRIGFYLAVLAAVAGWVLRVARPAGPRELLVPVVFAAAAVVFLWLYEVWIRELVLGPVIAGAPASVDADARRRRVRRVFLAEVGLTALCLVMAHALLNLNWAQDGVLGATLAIAGAIVCIAGCALAIGSAFTRRIHVTAAG